jgi:hypothetical protein
MRDHRDRSVAAADGSRRLLGVALLGIVMGLALLAGLSAAGPQAKPLKRAVNTTVSSRRLRACCLAIPAKAKNRPKCRRATTAA